MPPHVEELHCPIVHLEDEEACMQLDQATIDFGTSRETMSEAHRGQSVYHIGTLAVGQLAH
jgi:hypothetical protein